MTPTTIQRVDVARTYLHDFVLAFTQSAKLLENVSDEKSIRKALNHLDKSAGLLHLGITQLELAAGYAPHPSRKAA